MDATARCPTLWSTSCERTGGQAAERLELGAAWEERPTVPARWGTPLDPRNALRASSTVVEQVNTARAAQGWAALGRVGLHTLRHTCASLLLAQGVHPRIAAQRMHAALRW